ncbi:MAG: glycosyltransferase family 2 protein [Candidatus Bathyarchaeia archaeon]
MLIAALNEQEGIGPTMEELQKVLVNPSFLVVDGNSTDRTVEIAKDFDAVVIPQKGAGKGDAVAEALLHLDGDAFDYVVLIDADYTYPAEYLPVMIRILEENPEVGMVCGNRFNSHLHVKSMRNAFYFGNRLLAFTHNLLNGVALRDPLTGLRVVRAEALRGWLPKSKGFDIEVELNHHVERRGYDIREVDISYRPRLGEKKLKLKHGLTIMKRIFAESMY